MTRIPWTTLGNPAYPNCPHGPHPWHGLPSRGCQSSYTAPAREKQATPDDDHDTEQAPRP